MMHDTLNNVNKHFLLLKLSSSTIDSLSFYWDGILRVNCICFLCLIELQTIKSKMLKYFDLLMYTSIIFFN